MSKALAAIILTQSALFAGCTSVTLSAGQTAPSDAAPSDAASSPEATLAAESGPDADAAPPDATSSDPDASEAGYAPLPTLIPGTCSALSYGLAIAPASDDECAHFALGRWQFCGGDAGADPPLLPNDGWPGAGLEFAWNDDAGTLDFYVLGLDDAGVLVRSEQLDQLGYVDQPSVWTGSACHYWAAPTGDPGTEFGWTIQRFQGPDALLIDGNFSYVPAPSAPTPTP